MIEYMCVLIIILIFMFNHFQYDILMYDGYFSRHHKCRENVCPPLSSPMVDFNIEAYVEKKRLICSH